MFPRPDTHYKTLDIAETATAEEVRQAFRKAALQWHPDKVQENKTVAEEKFKKN